LVGADQILLIMENPFKPDDKVITKVKGIEVEAVVRLVWNNEVQVRLPDGPLVWRTVKTVADNDDIVTCYMDDEAFQGAAFPILAKEIFASINAAAGRKSIDEIVAGGEGNNGIQVHAAGESPH
jgi:hypothetical protein